MSNRDSSNSLCTSDDCSDESEYNYSPNESDDFRTRGLRPYDFEPAVILISSSSESENSHVPPENISRIGRNPISGPKSSPKYSYVDILWKRLFKTLVNHVNGIYSISMTC